MHRLRRLRRDLAGGRSGRGQAADRSARRPQVRVRLDRVARALKAAKIPLHVWNEEKLPTIEAAREKILPNAPAVPASTRRVPALATVRPSLATTLASEAAMTEADMRAAVVEGGPATDPFADTDRDWSQGEVIEVLEPSTSSWFDELDSVTAELPSIVEALEPRAHSTSAAANSRARKVCRSASFSPTPTK